MTAPRRQAAEYVRPDLAQWHVYEPMPGHVWFPTFCCRVCHLAKAHQVHADD